MRVLRRLAAAGLAMLVMPFCAGIALAAGDGVVVRAYVDADQIGEQDSVTLTIEVSGSDPGHVEEPDLSGLADFTVASGPSKSTSSSMVWSGGGATASTSIRYSYVLLPRRKGTLTIPTISVKMGSRIRRTEPISVEVVEGTVGRGRARGRGPGLQGPATPGRRQTDPRQEGELIVEAQLDRKEAWLGEQILLTYKVYTQMDLLSVPAPQSLPSYTGFWVEEIPVDPRSTIQRVTRQGKDFVEITLMKKALFATASGDLTIEETIFELPVKAASRDPFDSLFFTPSTTLYRKSAPLSVRIKSLPIKGRPESFTGAVGKFTVNARADRETTQVNDAVGLRVEVKGTGNIQTVGEPALPPLADYRRYEPKVEQKKEITKDRIGGSKNWSWVLTPLAPGQQDIPPIRFAYFDPSRAAYVDLSSELLPVLVQRGDGREPSVAGRQTGRREVAAFGRDISHIKPASELNAGSGPFHRSAWFGTLVLAPALLNAGLLLALRRRDHLAANTSLVRGRRARAVARRRLRAARSLAAADKGRAFHAELGQALRGYLADKLNVSASGLTLEIVDQALAARGVEEPAREKLRRCLEDCDFAQFAPVAATSKQMQSLLERSEQAIADLERRILPAAAA